MRYLLVPALAILLALTTAAHAQDNQVIVIGEDGSVTVKEGASSPPKAKEQTKAAPKAEPEQKSVIPPKPVAAKPAPAVKPPIKPAKKPAPPKQASPQKTKAKEKTAKNAASPDKKKTAPAAQKKADHKQAAPVATPSTALPSQRLGPNMTPEDAILIALDVAPPSRSVDAYPVNYKGLHAYQVIFRSDEGDRSIFVDRETGKIVK